MRSRINPFRFAGLLALGLLAGCSVKVKPPQVLSDAPLEAWARVLKTSVDAEGRIDFAGIRAAPADLNAMVAYVARKSPASDPAAFPSIEGRLAYYINAYNALAMHHAVFSEVKPKSKLRFFYFSELRIGGRWMSLFDLEKKVIRPVGEPRIHFALNCMSVGCPRLPQEPFVAEKLESQLETAAREFFNSDRQVVIDEAAGIARYSRILKWYKRDFLLKSRSLTAYVNRYRDAKVSEDLKVKFLPYDWALNVRPAPAR